MRVYEFSKKSGIPNKELLDMLKKGGFKITTHMAVLTDEAVSFLEKELKPAQVTEKKQAQVKQPIQAKAPEIEKIVTKPVQHPVSEKKIMQEQKEVVPEKKQPIVSQPSAPKRVEIPVKKVIQPQPKAVEVQLPQPQLPKEIIAISMLVDELAQKMRKPVGELILALLKKGIVATKNQMLQEKVVADLIRQFGFEVIVAPKKAPQALEKKVTTTTESVEERMPVIVVMGHVDHGKTTLLDYIRKTRIAAKEKGGITQHLGAYEVDTAHGGIVFLDTPGHEAFSQIRMRGIKVADVAVLVVAADDSVKPQTIEAIKHAKALDVPIIVAVNKIDKVDPVRVDVVKRDLTSYDIIPEEWGGQSVFVPISAKLGTGVDQLLEILALQSQVMELKANPNVPGKAIVLESKLEKGRGAVATIICQEGRVVVGDFFVCGSTQGKINSMVDSFGRHVAEVGPSIPVQIAGFDDLANVGDAFEIVTEKEFREFRASKGERRVLMPRKSSEENTVNVLIKADGNASIEALLGSLNGLGSKGDKEVYVVHSGVGSITESDVVLAGNTESTIYGLHVKVEANAITAAQKNAVSIRRFDIIYKLSNIIMAQNRM